MIRRDPLLTGLHEAFVTVATDAGPAAAIQVLAEKPLTTPQIIPWIEVDSMYAGRANPERLDQTVEGLRIWQHITDF